MILLILNEIRATSLNAQSLVEAGRVEELEGILIRHKINICFLQETFLKKRHSCGMNNYHVIRTDRNGVRGGGTAIAIEKNMDFVVVPVKELAQLSLLEATGVMIKLSGRAKLFCLSIYNPHRYKRITGELSRIMENLCLGNEENFFIVGSDMNALHTQWGFRRTHRRGNELFRFIESTVPIFGTRVLASRLPSRPVSESFPDLFLVKDTLLVPNAPAGVVNCLPLVTTTFSDHRMLVITCECPLGEQVAPASVAGRLASLRSGVSSITGEKLGRELLRRREEYGLGSLSVNHLAERTLTEEELNSLTERLSSLVVDSMEGAMKRRRPQTTLFIPPMVKRWQRV